MRFGKIRAGLVGLGDMGTGHLEALKLFPKVEIAALCDTNRSRLHAAQKRLPKKIAAFTSYEDLLDYNLRSLDAFCKYCTPDFMSFAEDLSYNHGPMLSKGLFDEFLAPYYKRIVPELKKRGIKVFVDTDGLIHDLVPWFLENGFDGFLPLERMAKVDVNFLRDKYPKLLMIGAFDKTIMHLGETALRKEFERILPVMRSGGYIPSVDHQTPPGVSLQDYKLYMKLLVEYCTKAAGLKG